MSNFIDKLFGGKHDEHTDSKTITGGERHGVKQETHQTASTGPTHTVTARSGQHEGVNVRSTVTSDSSSTVSLASQQRLTDLVQQLGSTHAQIDEYAKLQTAKIDQEIQREIDQVVAQIRGRQDELLRRATDRAAQIDSDYRARLQKMVEDIDAEKAKNIAEIEGELNQQQANILNQAKAEIDALNKKAANLKIGVLQDAQAKASLTAGALSAEAQQLGQATTIHQSAGTTVIKTETTAAAQTEVGGKTTITAAQATSPTITGIKTTESTSFVAQQKK